MAARAVSFEDERDLGKEKSVGKHKTGAPFVKASPRKGEHGANMCQPSIVME